MYLGVNTVSYKRVQQKRDQVALVCGHLLRTWYLLEGSELWSGLKLQPGRLFQKTCLEWQNSWSLNKIIVIIIVIIIIRAFYTLWDAFLHNVSLLPFNVSILLVKKLKQCLIFHLHTNYRVSGKISSNILLLRTMFLKFPEQGKTNLKSNQFKGN